MYLWLIQELSITHSGSLCGFFFLVVYWALTMPLLKKKQFSLAEPPKDLDPCELVYQVRFTKEIFRDYQYPFSVNLELYCKFFPPYTPFGCERYKKKIIITILVICFLLIGIDCMKISTHWSLVVPVDSVE